MSDLDDKDFALRAPYVQRILELEAQVAQMREALQIAQDVMNDNKCGLMVVDEALSTPTSDWIEKHDAEVRADALTEAAEWFESSPINNALAIRSVLLEMASDPSPRKCAEAIRNSVTPEAKP